MKINNISLFTPQKAQQKQNNHHNINSSNTQTNPISNLNGLEISANYNRFIPAFGATDDYFTLMPGVNIKKTTEPKSEVNKLSNAINYAMFEQEGHENLIVLSNGNLAAVANELADLIDNEIVFPQPETLTLIFDDRINTPIYLGIDEEVDRYAIGEEVKVSDQEGTPKNISELKEAPKIFRHGEYLFLNNRIQIPIEINETHQNSEDEVYVAKVRVANFLTMFADKDFDIPGIKMVTKDSPAKANDGKPLHPNFSDIGGYKKVLQSLEEDIVFPLIYPEAFGHIMNKGAILQGPPGTGKTYIAKALANEITNRTGQKISFFDVDGTSLNTSAVGETEERWRKLFQKAKDEAPSIIFIDEGESVAQNRDGSNNSRYDDKTVNQILTLMSNLEKSDDKVFVIMATNKLALLDSAITRDGRFGNIITIDLPDEEGCREILDIHLREKTVGTKVDIADIAKQLHQMKASGSKIAAVAERAQRFAMRDAGIFEQMRNGTYSKDTAPEVIITTQNIAEAIDEAKATDKVKKGTTERTRIKGFAQYSQK